MPSKVIIIVIEFMFLGINMFWALLRVESGPKHIYAREHKLYCYIVLDNQQITHHVMILFVLKMLSTKGHPGSFVA